MKTGLLASAFCWLCVSNVYASEPCARYAPVSVTLSGKLERMTFPGRPNFESVAEGDEAETGFYLLLSKKLCVDGDKDAADSYPQSGVGLIQLVLDKEGYEKLLPSLGRNVTLEGTLYAAHTGHHHAPVLMQNGTVVNTSVRKNP